MKTNVKVVAVALMAGVALGSLTGLSSCQRQQEPALKPIDKAALQNLVDTTAKELLIPGAVVLLRTPQGEFTNASEFIERKRVMMRAWVSGGALEGFAFVICG